MSVDVKRRGSARKHATEPDGNCGNRSRCQENIFQPGELAIKRGSRGKYSKEVVEKRPRKPGHHNFVGDSKSSQVRWNRTLKQGSAREKTAKKERQEPCVGLVRPQKQDREAHEEETQGIVTYRQAQQM